MSRSDYPIRDNSDKLEVVKAIYALTITDKPYIVTIRKKHPPRSLDQNSYYWGVIIELTAAALGYSRNEMHEVWKWELLGHDEITGIGGKKIEIARSTTDLSTAEAEEYYSQIRMKASELGIYIPEPNE
jgi:hypothetical protein